MKSLLTYYILTALTNSRCLRKHPWTTETASLATLTRPLTLVSGLKKDSTIRLIHEYLLFSQFHWDPYCKCSFYLDPVEQGENVADSNTDQYLKPDGYNPYAK